MKITLRQEKPGDYPEISEVIKAAFREAAPSDHREHLLVERLRKSKAFIPSLSIVAETGGKIAGHILLTKIQITNENNVADSLALAPLSVKPGFQGKGIGGQLIEKSHETARAIGYKSVVVLGHDKYYRRFGYIPAGSCGIQLPFDVPEENCMVVALTENGLQGVKGSVKYAKEFFE